MRYRLLILGLLMFGCKNYYTFPSFSERGNPFMVVEIPAGTNLKYEYNPKTNRFEIEEIDGEPRSIDYLPYPGNYGFVPSTLMDEARGGDGDPVDVLVIGSNIKKGSLLEFAPIGVIRLLDEGVEDHKIIGIAVNSEITTIGCRTMSCLRVTYPGIDQIIETWFSNYDPGTAELLGWEDEKYALEMIRKWQIE